MPDVSAPYRTGFAPGPWQPWRHPPAFAPALPRGPEPGGFQIPFAPPPAPDAWTERRLALWSDLPASSPRSWSEKRLQPGRTDSCFPAPSLPDHDFPAGRVDLPASRDRRG